MKKNDKTGINIKDKGGIILKNVIEFNREEKNLKRKKKMNKKKMMKHFFKIVTSICIDIFAPIIAPNIPKIDIIIANFKSIFLFLKLTQIATIAVGIKKIKFVA